MNTFIQELLNSRGISTKEEQEIFFNPKYERDVHDPFLFTDMSKAVTRILTAIDTNEKIAIYSDFDADGIPAGVLLHDFFIKAGHTNFVNYIPHRDIEGYGFHTEAVEKLNKQGVTLIITVDVGITDCATAEDATSMGVDVIVTDHHLPKENIPKAIAVINPQREDDMYPCKHLCGSGVAYKLVQAILLQARKENKNWVSEIPEGWEKWLLDLVAIATVGDMVPLLGENRALVHFGLLVLHKTKRPGIYALCRKLGIRAMYLTEDDIGFSIAPRINASSRMGNPETALTLLTTTDEDTAREGARSLESLNNKRKGSVASIVRELKKHFENGTTNEVLVAGNPQWNPALLGLAANSLVDAHGKMVCLWGRDGTGTLKGSCRGNGKVGVVDIFNEIKDTLSHFGGHAHAGGFSVLNEKVHLLQEVCNSAYTKLLVTDTDDASVAHFDTEMPNLPLQEIHAQLLCMTPFGIGNKKPIFRNGGIIVQSMRQFGKEELHLELQIQNVESGRNIRAIAFFKNKDSFSKPLVVGKEATILATLDLSRFAGRIRYELHIIDVV